MKLSGRYGGFGDRYSDKTITIRCLQKKQQMHNYLSYRKIDVKIAAFYLKPRISLVNGQIILVRAFWGAMMKFRQFGMLVWALTLASCKSISEPAIKPSELEGNWIYHLKAGEYHFNSAFHFNGKEVIFAKNGESIPLALDHSGLLLIKKSDDRSYTFAKLKKINRDLYLVCDPERETENCDFITRQE